MINKKNAPLVPMLRFPEFRTDKPWDEELMSKVYCFKGNNSFSRDKLNYEYGTIKNIHYGDIHSKFSTHFNIAREEVPYINEVDLPEVLKADNFCIEGDVVFADASEDIDDIGKAIEIIGLDGEQVVSGLHTILARQTKASFVIGFGGHLFKSKRVRSQIQKESQGAKVLGLAASRLAKIQLPFPSSKDEQQKIADCLSSLDELIAAQARKVDALKAHKKGLMQRLFPGKAKPNRAFGFQSSIMPRNGQKEKQAHCSPIALQRVKKAFQSTRSRCTTEWSSVIHWRGRSTISKTLQVTRKLSGTISLTT